MGAAAASDACACWNRTPTNDGSASHSECHSLRSCYRLSVAGARARISAALDRARLLLQLAGRRDLALHQSQSRQARASGRRAQADAVGRHHRQPERKDHDMAKKVKGRKRHVVTDTEGSLLAVLVQTANVQDNHGAVPLLRTIGRMFPKLRHIFADRVYRGPKLLDAIAELGRWTIEIVTRSQTFGTFKPESRRWVVERTFAWLGRNRRLAKDFEASIASAEAWVMVASIRLLSRRLARA